MKRIALDRLWLAGAAVLTIAGIGVLWPFTSTLPQACPAIYPVPQWCTTPQPQWVAIVAIGLVLCLLTAAVVVYFTVERPRIVIGAIAGAMVLVYALVVVVMLTQSVGTGYPIPNTVVN